MCPATGRARASGESSMIAQVSHLRTRKSKMSWYPAGRKVGQGSKRRKQTRTTCPCEAKTIAGTSRSKCLRTCKSDQRGGSSTACMRFSRTTESIAQGYSVSPWASSGSAARDAHATAPFATASIMSLKRRNLLLAFCPNVRGAWQKSANAEKMRARRPRQERKRETVDAILTPATRLFVSEGYARPTTNRVTDAAGVSHHNT